MTETNLAPIDWFWFLLGAATYWALEHVGHRIRTLKRQEYDRHVKVTQQEVVRVLEPLAGWRFRKWRETHPSGTLIAFLNDGNVFKEDAAEVADPRK